MTIKIDHMCSEDLFASCGIVVCMNTHKCMHRQKEHLSGKWGKNVKYILPTCNATIWTTASDPIYVAFKKIFSYHLNRDRWNMRHFSYKNDQWE